MKKIILILISVLLLGVLPSSLAIAEPPIPFLVGVKVYYGGSPANNVVVIITNTRTKEQLDGNTSSYGEYLDTLSNLREGFKEEDNITIVACVSKSMCKQEVRKVGDYRGGIITVFEFNKPLKETIFTLLIKMGLTIVSLLLFWAGVYLTLNKRRLISVLSGLILFGLGMFMLFLTWVTFDLLRMILENVK